MSSLYNHIFNIKLKQYITNILFFSLFISPTTFVSMRSLFLIFESGASGSFCSNVRATVYAEMYGRKYLGSVQSIASSLTVFGSAIGPFPFGVARDSSGSYRGVFAVASLFPLIAAIVVFFFGYRGTKKGGTSTSQKGFSSVLNENLDGDGDGMDEDDAIDEI